VVQRAGDFDPPRALDRVKAPHAHEAFDLRNPNRARALLHSFATSNPRHFHAADGGGYRWVAEQVVALDRLNPQVASRLARAFDRWKKYERGAPGPCPRGARVDPGCRGPVAERGGGREPRGSRLGKA
jgi:aminopeptidase N